MTGLPVQKFVYMYGAGANGKSALSSLMRRIMGDYAAMMRIESLTGQNRKSGSDATPDMLGLRGGRAAFTGEPEEGVRLQEPKMKEILGGEAMLIRSLHENFFEIVPIAKITFTANGKLDIRGTDDGIWRRVCLVPFLVQIPEAERDEKLVDKLFEDERSGILNWLITGLIDYLEGGLQEPDAILEATAEYRNDSDPIGQFLASNCIVDGGTNFIRAVELRNACALYMIESLGAAWKPGTISRKIKERAKTFVHPESNRKFMPHKRSTPGFTGIRLTSAMAARLRNCRKDMSGFPIGTGDEDNDEGGYGS